MATTRERVALDDASWLQMDTRDNPMVVNVALDFAGALGFELFVELVERRVVHRFPRFSQRVVAHPPSLGRLGAPHWQADGGFDVADHLAHHRVEGPDPDAAVSTLLGELASQPLERSRPRWTAHLIDRPGRSTVLFRTHHSMADGLGLVQLIYALADPRGDGGAHPGQLVIADDAQPPRWPALPAPSRALDNARVYRKLGRLADQRNPLRGPVTGTKQLLVSAPVDLEAAKAVARSSGATLNDLGLAVVAGAIRRHLLAAVDDELPDRVGVTIPFNLRPADQPLPPGLGNQIGLVFVNLPVVVADPRERLEQLRARMAAIKSSPEGAIVRSGMALVGAITHRPTARAWMRLFTQRSTAIITNIAGPHVPLRLGGVHLESVVLWVPTSGSVGLGLSIVTYAGALRVGVQADVGAVPDAPGLVRALDHELGSLERYGAAKHA